MTPAGSVLADDLDDRSQAVRRPVLYGLIVFAILQLAVNLLGHPLDGRLSPGTVRIHLSAAIQKLGARHRAEAAQVARQTGRL